LGESGGVAAVAEVLLELVFPLFQPSCPSC
jgi:hypothetical protein